MDGTLFRKRVFLDVIKLRVSMKSFCINWEIPNLIPHAIVETGREKTQRKPFEDRGRYWSDVPSRHRVLINCQKPGERHGAGSPSEPPEGTNLSYTLILGSWPPGSERVHFLFTLSCHTTPGNNTPHGFPTSILVTL